MKRLTITFFAILLVVGLAMPMTSVGANGSSGELIEEFNVDSNTWASGDIAYSSALIDGGHYVFEVSGTWYANAGITADAKYSESVGGETWDWQDACGSYETSWPNICELMVNGGPVDWGPYTDTHIYTLDWIGTGSAVGFKLYDINDNNSGVLTVKIYLLPVEVGIDIKPGSDPNSINLGSKGVVPVAILGSATFDASTVDPFSIELGGATVKVKGKSGNAGSLEDVNGDGYLDLVIQVNTSEFTLGDGVAELTGTTYGGIPIFGTDSISIVSK